MHMDDEGVESDKTDQLRMYKLHSYVFMHNSSFYKNHIAT